MLCGILFFCNCILAKSITEDCNEETTDDGVFVIVRGFFIIGLHIGTDRSKSRGSAFTLQPFFRMRGFSHK